MSLTFLRIPVVEATQYWDRLEEDLGKAAASAGVEFDGGEESGRWAKFVFVDITPDALSELATPVVSEVSGGTVKVTGKSHVTATLPATKAWISVLGSVDHPYDKAVRAAAKERSADGELTTWWAGSGYRRLLVQESHGKGRCVFVEDDDDLLVAAAVDLSLLDDDHPDPANVRQAAEANLDLVLTRTADHLARPLPRA